MTTKSQESFFALSSDSEGKQLYSTVHEDLPSKQSEDVRLEDKEKTRRRRGCGHPYRMRLNMTDDNRRPVSDGRQAADTHKVNEYSKPVREKQGRHPYRRGLKPDHSQQSQDGHQSRHPQQRAQVKKEPLGDMPRLAGTPQESSHQPHTEYPVQVEGEQQRRPKNLFPYHQRARKKRQAEPGQSFQNFGQAAQQKSSWQPPSSYSTNGYAHSGQSRKPRSHSSHDRDMQMNEPVKSVTQPIRSFGGVIERAKVFYKKRRQTFSPSSESESSEKSDYV